MIVRARVLASSGRWLSACLRRPSSIELIRRAGADGTLDRALGIRFLDHIGDVLERVERAAGPESAAVWPVKLAALVHEEAPSAVPALLQRAGLARQAPLVSAVLDGFGEVWKTTTEHDVAEYVDRHRGHAWALLLFEVAHENAATDRMREAAGLAGLAGDLAGWHTRLRRAPGGDRRSGPDRWR